jgi:hypothetical protein
MLLKAKNQEKKMDRWAEKKLRLACLKESSEYRSLWGRYGDQAKAAAAVYIDESSGKETRQSAWESLRQFFCDLDRFNIMVYPLAGEIQTILRVLDPFGWDTLFPTHPPFDFLDRPPVWQVWWEKERKTMPKEAAFTTSLEYIFPLKPSERLLLVDLSAKRADLMEHFKRFLDNVERLRKTESLPMSWEANYAKWDLDKTRFRHEAWQQLRVWGLRRQRKTYAEIAEETGLNLPAAKKAFARAFELIEGRKYDPELFKRDYREIASAELTKTCETCPLRDTCPELCPDVLPFVIQDQKSFSERLF